MNKYAIIGARTSSTDGERDSIEAQLNECRTWAEANGYEVIAETREDGISGALAAEQRPELRRGLEMLRAGKVNAYVWRGPDRLGRRADTGQVIESHRTFGDGILFVRVPNIENRFASIMSRSSLTGYSEGERVMIYDRTHAGRNKSALAGEGVGIGTLPKWLRFHRHQRTKKGEIADACKDCQTAEGYRLVEAEEQRVRRLVLGGYQEQKRSGAPPHELVRLRHESTVGGLRVLLALRADSVEAEYREHEKEKRRRERKETIRRVLACPTIDEAEATAKELGFITQRVPSPLTWQEFYAARQKALAVPNATRGRPPKKRYPLQGRIICSQHNLTFTPRRSNGSAGYVYAACTATIGYMAERHGLCEMPRIPWTHDTRRGRNLVSLVRETLAMALESPETIEQHARDYLASMQARIDQLAAGTGDLEAELERLKTRKTKLGMLWADGDMPDDEWRKERAKFNRQIGEIEEQLHRDDAQELKKLKRRYKTAKALLAEHGLGSPYSVETDTELRAVAEKIDLRVYVESDRLRLEGAIPLGEVELQPDRTNISLSGKLRSKEMASSRRTPSRS